MKLLLILKSAVNCTSTLATVKILPNWEIPKQQVSMHNAEQRKLKAEFPLWKFF